MKTRVQIRQCKRKSLAMRVTPGGVVVSIPHSLAVDSPQVVAFVEEGLAKLRALAPVPDEERVNQADVRTMVEQWAARIGVEVEGAGFRAMPAEWGAMSTEGRLWLAEDVVRLPRRLVEYVICHELLHRRVPKHDGVFRLLLSQYLPDWRTRERELAGWTLALEGKELVTESV